MLGEYLWYLQCVLKVILDDSEALWSQKSAKNDEKSDFSGSSKINFEAIFYVTFCVSAFLFISTCRMTIIFYWGIHWCSESISDTFYVSWKWFWTTLGRFEVKKSAKTMKSQIFLDRPKSILELFLRKFLRFRLYFHFYVSYDHNFLLTYSLMLGEYLWYLQCVLKVVLDDFEALWSEKIGKKW